MNRLQSLVRMLACSMFAFQAIAQEDNFMNSLFPSKGNHEEIGKMNDEGWGNESDVMSSTPMPLGNEMMENTEMSTLRIDVPSLQNDAIEDSIRSFTSKHHRLSVTMGTFRHPIDVDSDLYEQYPGPVTVHHGLSYVLAYEYMPLWSKFPYLGFGLRYYGNRYHADISGDTPTTCRLTTHTFLPTFSWRLENKGSGYYFICGFGYGKTSPDSSSYSEYNQLLEGHGFVSMFGTGFQIGLGSHHSLGLEVLALDYLRRNAPLTPRTDNLSLRYQYRF